MRISRDKKDAAKVKPVKMQINVCKLEQELIMELFQNAAPLHLNDGVLILYLDLECRTDLDIAIQMIPVANGTLSLYYPLYSIYCLL